MMIRLSLFLLIFLRLLVGNAQEKSFNFSKQKAFQILNDMKMTLVSEGLKGRTKEFDQFWSKLQRDCPELEEKCVKDIYWEKILQYIVSPRFIFSFDAFIHDELSLGKRQFPNATVYSYDYGKNEISFLIEEIIRSNLSWDHFFQANKYSFEADIYSRDLQIGVYEFYQNFLPISENKYYEDIFSNPKTRKGSQQANYYDVAKSTTKEQVDLASASDVAAGFMTTYRFSSRFYNNVNNVGRKKAAAIIKFAFCDVMIPGVELNSQERESELDVALNNSTFHNNKVVGEIHGAKKDCYSCHYERGLDPLASSLYSTYQVLSKRPYFGKIVFKRNGALVEEPFNGLAQYAQKIVNYPEFRKCQMQKFWKRYVGKDLLPLLGDNSSDQLDMLYLKTGGKPREIIPELLMMKYFDLKTNKNFVSQSITTPRDEKFGLEVLPILQRCQNCHQNNVVDFRNFPMKNLNGDDVTKTMLTLMADRLALFGNPLKRDMPPYDERDSSLNPLYFDLTPMDLKNIQNWMEAGAIVNGKKYLEQADIERMKGIKK